MSNGVILYRGPSMIDGSPIVAIATGLAKSSGNVKTGSLIQTWIIRDDMSPVEAIHSGADAAICGSCPHRGEVKDGKNVGRSCYVSVFQAPLSVFKAFQKGVYSQATAETLPDLFAGKRVRLGSYGDPAAVPFEVWEAVLSQAEAWTGYTHQWRDCDPRFARFVMASCDSQADYAAANVKGYRTFRVRAAGETLNNREIVCPASQEAGYKTSCASCIACGGKDAKARVNIAIIAHGSAAVVKNFNTRIAA